MHAPNAPTPGRTTPGGRLNLPGVPGDGGGVARFFKALLDAAQIAHAVINNRQS